MEIFGFAKNDSSFQNLIKLSQASICCNRKDLDNIIAYLNEVRDHFDEDVHWHYKDHNKEWTDKESDLIISLDRFDDTRK